MANLAPEYIRNPRRTSRAHTCCSASIAAAIGKFEATTEDASALGCRVVAPRLVRKGEPIRLVLRHPLLTTPLQVNGRVAWATDGAPWRLGIAFDETTHAESSRWFSQLLAAGGGFPTPERVPDRIPLAAMVFLGSPPRFVLDVTSDEMSVLQAIGSGASVAELVARFPGRRPLVERALFSLLAQRLATLSRGASVHPNAWNQVFPSRQPARQAAVPRREPERAVIPLPKRSSGSGRVRPPPIAARAGSGQQGGAQPLPMFLAMVPPERWSHG